MQFGLGFTLLLLIVGGFAAYWGDRVGMLVGRRRLSILGLRPRYTSRIISIGTGVLIVLFTLVSLIALSESVRQALFGMERLKDSVAALSLDVMAKNKELSDLEAQRYNLTDAIARLQEDNAGLQAQNDALKQEKDALLQQTAALQAETSKLEADRVLLERQLGELRKAGDYYFDQANRLQEAYSTLRQASFVYHSFDVITHTVVDARLPEAVLHQQLLDLIAAANQRVLQRGAGDAASGVGVRVDRVIPNRDGGYTQVDTDLVVKLAVEAIKSDPSLESVIVQLVAIANAARGEPVQADFSLIRNVRLYQPGEVVASHVFDGRSARSDIFEELVLWVQTQVRDAARKKGLMPQDDGSFGGISSGYAFQVVDEIAAHGSLVELVAYAEEECWTQGPLVLGFRVQRLGR